MKIKNLVLVGLLAAATQAGANFSFSVGAMGGLGRLKAEMKQADSGFMNAEAKCEKSRNNFFGAIFGEASKKVGKIDFGGFLMLTYLNAKPNTTFRFEVNPEEPSEYKVEFRSRGVGIAVGPKIGFSSGCFNFGAGVGMTFNAYKAKVNDLNPKQDKNNGSANLRTKLFRTMGAMPFVKVGYNMGDFEIFGFAGYNFSKKAKMVSDLKTAPAAAQNTTLAIAVHTHTQNDKIKIKTSHAIFGLGLSMKVA